MAKNKNRKQNGRQTPSTQAEQAQEQAHGAATDSQQAIRSLTQDGPPDAARKRQKRFGHN